MSILADLPPDTIFASDFRVVRKLSAGGMGAIYLAEQISTGRQRALKLMHPGLVGSPELRQKFALEARVGGRVHSEHVVEVVAAGVDGEVPWLAMELLLGEDVSAYVLRRGPVPKEELVSILGQVCHGLSAAHTAGIVHRDLKPENIFLAEARRQNESFTVKILDFGIAKVVEAARGSNTGAIGSPLWMAPEQTERDSEITSSTDIWALGLVAFYMLTGKAFWRAIDSGELALAAFLRELVIDPLPSATVRAGELKVGDRIPPGFDAWFARCVIREREARFQDSKECFASLCEKLGVSSTTGAHVRISTGGTPMREAPTTGPGQTAAMLGEAHTQVDESRASIIAEKAASAAAAARSAAIDDEDLPKAVVPVGGPSPALLIIGGVLLFVAIGAAAIFLIMRKPNGGEGPTRNGPVPSSSIEGALPFCPKGMVRIAGGDMTMGSNSGPSEEQPEHPVKVAPFCLDVTEVTVAEYTECVKKNGCAPPQATVDWAGITKEEKETFSVFCTYGKERKSDHPMNCVSFDEAAAFCKYAGKRLPTEEQWEYAARGNDGRGFPWGHQGPNPKRVNGCDDGCARVARRTTETLGPRLIGDDGSEATSPVGAYPEGVGPFGAFDLAGNVAEWVDGPFCPYGQSACGTGARVTRGGSWMSDVPSAFRATARTKSATSARAPDVGLRCVK